MRAEVDCNPTEEPERVKSVLSKFFPGLDVKSDGVFFVESDNEESALETLKEVVWEKKILDTVRGRLLRSECEGKVTLLLNKQAAFAGRLGVCDEESESPLGALRVSFSSSLVDWFSPKTKEGRPI